MALTRALVDRARRVYVRESGSPSVEGAPSSQEQFGPFVAVRFRRQDESERDPAPTVRVDEVGALLIGPRDVTGELLMVNGRFTGWDADDMVEVHPAEGGVERWYVSSGVRPMRRRTGILGWRCSIRKTREAGVAVTGEDPLDPGGIVVPGSPEDGFDWTTEVG